MARAVRYPDDYDLAASTVLQAVNAKRRGPKPNQVTDVLFCGPPPPEAKNAWPHDKVERWGRASYEWVKQTFPGTIVAAAALHQDERAHHVHVLLVPLFDTDDKGPRIAWSKCQKSAAERLAGRVLKRPGEQMRVLQNAYHAQVGSRFGLERGEIGSKRKHEEPDSAKGLKDRLADTQERLRDARDELTKTARREVRERRKSAAGKTAASGGARGRAEIRRIERRGIALAEFVCEKAYAEGKKVGLERGRN